ncbi:hypothetical protein COEREDRAFT_5726 [Coemansia reversa NRRL 1564]|uniref:Phosphoribosyltransferase domain-containing protein n=1 Tax=Coemansia reversa (strain ATCC 12441 / NRRL 1564) TaxID=763665 RepID=A0A2G5BJM4_COERN|nr:hypothetical protein COEREDRAFT_5726 [Coemansia reversa NRRL 1564]|eukprot:PIA19206.1 hypothetical protein COEREDRAFT_5726 [Coemansia reversa NRRL 1564]
MAITATEAQSQETMEQQQQQRGRQAQFDDRIQAGHQLAQNLCEYAGNSSQVVVVSVSKGGAVVGAVVAAELGVGVQHFYYQVRSIPCPSIPRLSLGSVAGDRSVRIDSMIAHSMGMDEMDASMLRRIAIVDRKLLRDQNAFYLPPPTQRQIDGRTLIIVDDVIEAGDTIREAAMHLRHFFRPRSVVIAAPVCLADLRKLLRRHVDAVVDIVSPLFVGPAARWYAGNTTPSLTEQQLLSRMFPDGSDSVGADDDRSSVDPDIGG